MVGTPANEHVTMVGKAGGPAKLIAGALEAADGWREQSVFSGVSGIYPLQNNLLPK